MTNLGWLSSYYESWQVPFPTSSLLRCPLHCVQCLWSSSKSNNLFVSWASQGSVGRSFGPLSISYPSFSCVGPATTLSKCVVTFVVQSRKMDPFDGVGP